jgi:acid phosphatase
MSGMVSPSDASYRAEYPDTLLGERTPVGTRMSEPPARIPAFWNICRSARRFKAAVIGSNNVSESVEILRLSERGDGHAKEGEWYV